ncbi:MAG: HIT family protein [Thermogemmata sp.]|nr:HIT family protein [Thermogemmata sp.]
MNDFKPINCPFCSLPKERILRANTRAVAVADAFPVSTGHTLVIPLRHVTSFFDLAEDELIAIYELLHQTKKQLDQDLKPDGYNIGVNVGTVAGQTVEHVHLHLIPRYLGDVTDPVGGVRNIIPGKGRY